MLVSWRDGSEDRKEDVRVTGDVRGIVLGVTGSSKKKP